MIVVITSAEGIGTTSATVSGSLTTEIASGSFSIPITQLQHFELGIR